MIEISNLCFEYKGSPNLFRDLNLRLDSGNIFGLLGKNGAGKTTLLKIIAGLLFPKSGQCKALNVITQKRLPEFLSEIYFVPEDIFVPQMTASALEKIYAPFYQRFSHDFFHNALTQLELPADKDLATLSYGQKKKSLLAFGLATNCRILLLDEPTNGLDIPGKSQVRKLLVAAAGEKKSVIIATHQVRDMANLIDPIIILDNGKVIFQQSLEDIAQHLYFSRQNELPQNASDIIYAERILGGYLTVTANNNNVESVVDLEVLFNAVIANCGKINALCAK